MKMDDMNKYLEDRGFEVDRTYFPYPEHKNERGGYYTFVISKGRDHHTSVYEWPADQLKFMERMIENFEKDHPQHKRDDNGITIKIDHEALAQYPAIAWSRRNPYIEKVVRHVLGHDKFDIEKVIFNPPATIVLWSDGTKTVVKADGEKFDPEKGLAMAISKKALGNKGNYYNTFTKWLPKDGTVDILEKLAQLRDAVDKLHARFGPKGE